MKIDPIRLTDAFVEGLETDGPDRIWFDALQPGFGVRRTPAGTKIFLVQARAGGKPRRVPLGTFPTMSTAEARREARGALQDIRNGRDPKAEQEARQRAAEAGQITVEQFIHDRWLPEYVRAKLKPRTVADYEKLVIQKIGP